jgi:hypothetical protein
MLVHKVPAWQATRQLAWPRLPTFERSACSSHENLQSAGALQVQRDGTTFKGSFEASIPVSVCHVPVLQGRTLSGPA